MKLTSSTLIAAAILLGSEAVHAVNLRFFFANNCSGGFLEIRDAQTHQCYNAGSPAASIRPDVSNVIDHTFAYANSNCQESIQASASDGACVRPSWTITSGKYFLKGINVRRTPEEALAESLPCAEPTAYGFVDAESGEDVVRDIPAGARNAVYEAFSKGELESFAKSFA
ncbi:hypothetical protein FA15DRAFT_711289 [Coprinopsis marcescibilis]|uniref:Uncharacterized protein n=1 Tax=Coprinopsis marcescibilis TaxID=230819 RepID=A0A5C3KA18_COPMA|nr:hypothetical protein FA15DRAFT_711289 [Coprinopsis marcescibilis]